MPPNYGRKTKGFTLVELSIVLVIIGLLVGGILAAMSIIDTARIIKTVKQIQQFDIAVANFKTRYNALPGDSVVTGTGNGDGNLEAAGGYPTFFDGEISRFWVDLNQSGFMPEVVFSSSPPGFSDLDYQSYTARNIPKAGIGKKAGVVAFGTSSSTVGEGDGTGNNFYGFTYYTSPFLSSHLPSGITAQQILAIDTKLDDGNVTTGAVLNNDGLNGTEMTVKILSQANY